MDKKMKSLSPVADFIVRIKNANITYKSIVETPTNKQIKEIAKILRLEGFINDYQTYNEDGKERMRVHLKYGDNKKRCINNIILVSKPQRRIYSSLDKLPRVKRGIGIAIISTSQGIITDKQARKIGQGGEIICYVW
jgi:small subunit ribosomal protein S8